MMTSDEIDKEPAVKVKPQRVFNQSDESSQSTTFADNEVLPELEPLQQKQVFGDDIEIKYDSEIVASIDQEISVTDGVLSPVKKTWSWAAKGLVVLVGTIVAIETVDFFTQMWLETPIIAGIYSGAFILALGLIGKVCIGEYRHLKRLKTLEHWHRDAQRMDNAEQIGEAVTLCQSINKALPQSAEIEQAVTQWQGALKDNFTDKEVMTLYSDTVLDKIDDQGLVVVSRYASETSLMVAISPLAVMDMALVLWRSIKMIDDICRLYGVKLGYWSRIKLIKTVLKNVVYAGVTELIADVGAAALSLELAGKLSSRAAQGLGAGLLTGRLGFKVMQLCRPVPALPNKQKRLGDLSKHLLGNIRRAITQGKEKK